ncbi:hypothetical protein Cgig2_011968 [Carnegiea gigantea]|uniref:Uncharacterized protein n=1 Tax=Carnegiea gigantea TaxID=171969 RepID=A0A9Q1GMV9_9CARY|nr:hypothetical protein Cgig2_011968 [Carnegiea gigantea]
MEDDIEDGMDAVENFDMFLNLDNIEDVEMSTDSSKRKRVEEGEDLRIPTLQVLPPSFRLVYSFWDANASISWRATCATGFFDIAHYYITKADFCAYHGLDLSYSTYPYAHSHLMFSTASVLTLSNMATYITIGGGWILCKCTQLNVAPSFGEQSNFWNLWYSPPLIMKSMMRFVWPETSSLSYFLVHIPYLYRNALSLPA